MDNSPASRQLIGQLWQDAYTYEHLLIVADLTLPIPPHRLQNRKIDLMFLRIVQEDLVSSSRWRLAATLPIAVLLLFTLLGWHYRQQTPLLETPDEPSHFEAANYIAQNRSLPPRPEVTRSGAAPTVSVDIPYYYAPPLYYLLASLLIDEADTAQFAQAVVPNPNFERGEGINLGSGSENKNMFVHTAVQREPFQAEWAASMWRVRLLSLFFGTLTIVGCYGLAQQLWPKKWRWRLTAVALVLFNPTFLYLSNGVSNDTLLISLSTWSFVLMGSLLQDEAAKIGWREWTLALLLGCAILTKQTGFILLPPALLLIVNKARQQQWSRLRLLTVLGIGVAIITAVGGWWYLLNGIRYGDPLALEGHNALPPAENILERLLFMVEQSWGAFKSYWVSFGWATIFVGQIWYIFFITITTLGATGWLGKRSVQLLKRPFPSQAPSAKLTQLLWLVLLLNGGLMVVWLWRTAAPYGRLLFPVIAPIACLLVMGWQHWLARLHLSKPLPETILQLGVLLPLVGLALLSPSRYLQPAFAPVAVAPNKADDYLPLQATFDDSIQLLGYTLNPQTVQAGDIATLTLFWQLTQPTATSNNLVTFIQVAPLNPEAQVAATSQLLGTPRYPSSFWQPDEIIVQQHQLKIAVDTPVPSLYWFDVILFDEDSQTRLPVAWQEQLLSENLFRVGPRPIFAKEQTAFQETAVSTPTIPTQYNFSQQIMLNGYDIVPVANGSGLQMTLFWQAIANPTANWIVFVHLLDKNGELIAQGDGIPRQGNFPTSWWTAGTIIPDVHLLNAEINCANLSEYTIFLGFYNPTTDERLPINDSTGQQLPDGAIEIKPSCNKNIRNNGS
ncbi:MAG: phospholipid carrier-dependent glycosyltransferase [Chloroflexi bacterium]|nr:phospholipid carrier-dependent glycosyltransferase [Chloroflexota bacterium]